MTAGAKSGKAQNEHRFSGLPPKADLPPDLRTTPAASSWRTRPSRRRLVAVRWRAVLVVAKGQRPHPRRTEPTSARRLCLAQCAARLIAIAAFARDLMSLRVVDQRRVKPLRIHRLVQKAVSSGADLAPRRARIAADEERWNRGKCWNRERAAEPFDGVDSGHSS